MPDDVISSPNLNITVASRFWTSRRGHRCRSTLLPLGTRLHFHRAGGSAFPMLVEKHRILLTHDLALSTSQFLHKKKSLQNTSMHSGELEPAKSTLLVLGNEVNLLDHRGCPPVCPTKSSPIAAYAPCRPPPPFPCAQKSTSTTEITCTRKNRSKKNIPLALFEKKN